MDIINAIYDLILGVLNQSQQSVILSPQESFFWIPLAFSAVSTAVTAGMSASANNKNRKMLKAQEAEDKADYLREYYRGALDNEGAQAYLKKLDSRMKRADKATENAITASGATHENALAAKQANNEVYSDAVADLVESEQARKDEIKSGYKSAQRANTNALMQQNTAEAATWSQVGQGIADAAMGVGNAYGWKWPSKAK
jgi:predicted transcriptional regulator